jgi:predicted nucleic acid-binding protein
MNYVLDSSIAVKWVIPEADTAAAIRLRDAYLVGKHALFAPDVFPIEVAHAIAKAERQGRISAGDGVPYLTDLLTMLPILVESLSLLPRAFAIASAARIGVYDCLYVALAESRQYEFLTADDRLIKALQPQFPWIKSLADAP